MPERRIPSSLDHLAALSWRFLLVVAAGAVLLLLLVELRLVVLPVIVALFATTLLWPPTAHLRRRGWPPAASAGVVLLVALAATAGFGAVLVPQFLTGLGPLGESVGEAIQRVQRWLSEGPLTVTGAELDRYVQMVVDQARQNARQIALGILGGAVLAVELVAGFVLVLVVLFFFLKDGDRMASGVLRLVSERRRPLVERLGSRAWGTMTAYIRGLALVGLVDAVLIGLGLLILGVPLVVPLATLVFLGAFFPLVGAFLSGLLAVVVALVSGGLLKALLVLALILAVQQVEGHVLAPVVLGRALRLHPLVIVLVLTAGAVAAGLVGAFLSVPIAALVVVLTQELRKEAEEGPSAAGGQAASP